MTRPFFFGVIPHRRPLSASSDISPFFSLLSLNRTLSSISHICLAGRLHTFISIVRLHPLSPTHHLPHIRHYTMKGATSLVSTFAAASGSRALQVRTFTSTPSARSALDDLSSSIEKLAQSRASASPSSSTSASGAVHNPRSTSPTRERQTVSGRAFMNGHYYNPSTLSYTSITQRPNRLARPLLGPSKAEAVQQDLIHQNGLKPGKPSLHDDSYKNAAILANYVTEMGKIMGRSATGLTRKSQRSVGKAVRRARSMGLLPVMSRGGTRVSGAGWK